jgi:Na+-transporting NADH:ubiquinone oxidoreductase subunit NqrB
VSRLRGWLSAWWRGDPRRIQLTYQVVFMAIGLSFLRFSITPVQIGLTLAAGVLTQAIFLRSFRLRGVGYLSALNASFSVCMLMRSETLWGLPLAAILANASKFLLRVRAKHVYNPSNFGIVVSLLLFPASCYMVPAQWGYELFLSSLCLVLGSTVVYRVRRYDISWTFFVVYLALVALRVFAKQQGFSAWLFEINAGLVIFSFFMISDPKTIPNHRAARIVFALLMAGVAYLLTSVFYRFNAALWTPAGKTLTSGVMAYAYHTNGILFSLFLCSPLVPWLDRFWRADSYRWDRHPEAERLSPATGVGGGL